MTSTLSEFDYNSRLFGGGIYGAHHLARFRWLRHKLRAHKIRAASILELGCFDGRSIEYLPMPIDSYVGLDAGWESDPIEGIPRGINAARSLYAHNPHFEFMISNDPRDIRALPGSFDVGISLETLEHIPPDRLEDYLEAISEKVTGRFYVSVPNEKGVPVLAKWLAARIVGVRRAATYTCAELLNAVMGRIDELERNEHKGFDYMDVVRQLRRHFNHVAVEGIGFGPLPHSIQLTIGIVAAHLAVHGSPRWTLGILVRSDAGRTNEMPRSAESRFEELLR